MHNLQSRIKYIRRHSAGRVVSTSAGPKLGGGSMYPGCQNDIQKGAPNKKKYILWFHAKMYVYI